MPGNSLSSPKPKWSKKASEVFHVKGLPGVDLLGPGCIQPNSKRTSIVPLLRETPRIFSISERVTGWWYAIIDKVSVAALDRSFETYFSIFKYSEISDEVLNA